eukprot:UN15476
MNKCLKYSLSRQLLNRVFNCSTIGFDNHLSSETKMHMTNHRLD